MKEKRKLNPLKKGERVRVYGWVQMHHSPYKPRAGGPATVTYVEDERFIHVKFDDEETHYSAHPRQCVRLKPKKAPAAPERVEWFEVVDENNKMQVGFGARAHAEIMVKANPSCRVAHLVELREGERILSRADVAEAWDAVFVIKSSEKP